MYQISYALCTVNLYNTNWLLREAMECDSPKRSEVSVPLITLRSALHHTHAEVVTSIQIKAIFHFIFLPILRLYGHVI